MILREIIAVILERCFAIAVIYLLWGRRWKLLVFTHSEVEQ